MSYQMVPKAQCIRTAGRVWVECPLKILLFRYFTCQVTCRRFDIFNADKQECRQYTWGYSSSICLDSAILIRIMNHHSCGTLKLNHITINDCVKLVHSKFGCVKLKQNYR